jgi:hypothetical protein
MLWTYMGPLPAELPTGNPFSWTGFTQIISEIPCNWLRCRRTRSIGPFRWMHTNCSRVMN